MFWMEIKQNERLLWTKPPNPQLSSDARDNKKSCGFELCIAASSCSEVLTDLRSDRYQGWHASMSSDQPSTLATAIQRTPLLFFLCSSKFSSMSKKKQFILTKTKTFFFIWFLCIFLLSSSIKNLAFIWQTLFWGITLD